MNDPLSKALFWPFTQGALSPPEPQGAEKNWAFLNARASTELDPAWAAHLVCAQPDRRLHDELSRFGFETHAELGERRDFSVVLVALGRDRHEGRGLIAEAHERAGEGGLILVAGAKDDGAASLEKELGRVVELDGVLPKAGCRIFWWRKRQTLSAEAGEILAGWRRAATMQPQPVGGFVACPGMFSWQEIDEGSRFLAQHLMETIAGDVADFGCGWGYLSLQLVERCPGVAVLDLYDSDARALACAKINLNARPPACRLNFHWQDLSARHPAARPYDWVVMNPPFHRGRAAEPSLGQAFIAAAARTLKPRGRLLMVANRALPYERTLDQHFTAVERIAEDNAFKLLLASGRKLQSGNSSSQRSSRR